MQFLRILISMNTLSINNLSVSIDGKRILSNLSIDFVPRQLHAVMGPNGSGKSSLAFALAGHPRYQIDSGTILLNGIAIQDLPAHKRAQLGLFIAFQYSYPLPGVTCFTFLKEAYAALTGNKIDLIQFRQEVLDCFALMGLPASFLDRNVHEGFSGGEKKRFEMVQLMLFKPAIAILDEIDSGLDVDALKLVAQAVEYVRNARPSISIVLITHYQRILDYCAPDAVHLLMNGAIVQSGSSELAAIIEHKGYDGFKEL